jgi:hypothetical protein
MSRVWFLASHCTTASDRVTLARFKWPSAYAKYCFEKFYGLASYKVRPTAGNYRCARPAGSLFIKKFHHTININKIKITDWLNGYLCRVRITLKRIILFH